MISVALCTYNGEKFIDEQLTSIVNQTMPPNEIIICDDCSNDNTIAKVKEILATWDGKSKIIVNERNLGYRLNFEKAISLCYGDIIYLSDQDDVWDTKKIEIIQTVFAEHKDASMVFHDSTVVDKNLQELYKSFWKIHSFNYNEFLNHDYHSLLIANVIQGSACAFKKKVFEAAKPFSKTAFHDEWLALFAVAMGDVIPVPITLMKYRQFNNVIGGIPITVFEKIKKWTLHFYRSLRLRYNDLENRNFIFTEYALRTKSFPDFSSKFNYKQYIFFLKQRLNYMKNKPFKLVTILPMYLAYTHGVVQAMKEIIKDTFTFIIVHR
jgi:glycosyltransferase involved in cell wall biosynthesis